MTEATPWLRSTLAGDPDLEEIVGAFVAEMPARIATIVRQAETRSWPQLQRTAHQLKGAAGSYGFAPISEAAAKVEQSIQQRAEEEEIRQAVNDLIALCRRAR